MSIISLSCSVKGGNSAIALVRNGRLVQNNTVKLVGDKELSSNYSAVISTLTRGFGFLRKYIENNKDITSVIIECNCNTVVKWIERGQTTQCYAEELIKAIDLLNDIPVRYRFIVVQKPMALNFTGSNFIKKEKLESIFDM